MPVSSLIAGSRMLTAEVLALTTSVERQVAASTPPVPLDGSHGDVAQSVPNGRSGALRVLHPFGRVARAAGRASAERRGDAGWGTPRRRRLGHGSARSPRGGSRRERPEPPQVPEQPPEAVLDFLRQLGVAMAAAGDSADRVTLILDDVAKAYAARGVQLLRAPDRRVRPDRGGRRQPRRLRAGRATAAPARPDRRALPADRRHPARQAVGVSEASDRLDDVLVGPAAVPGVGPGGRLRRAHRRPGPAAEPDRWPRCRRTSGSAWWSASSRWWAERDHVRVA